MLLNHWLFSVSLIISLFNNWKKQPSARKQYPVVASSTSLHSSTWWLYSTLNLSGCSSANSRSESESRSRYLPLILVVSSEYFPARLRVRWGNFFPLVQDNAPFCSYFSLSITVVRFKITTNSRFTCSSLHRLEWMVIKHYSILFTIHLSWHCIYCSCWKSFEALFCFHSFKEGRLRSTLRKKDSGI